MISMISFGETLAISGTLIESAMTAGFLSYGANVKLLGVIPTPAVAYLTKKLNADASVVISASHNTFEFNGVKFLSNKGMKIPDDLEEEIEEIIDSDRINKLYSGCIYFRKFYKSIFQKLFDTSGYFNII